MWFFSLDKANDWFDLFLIGENKLVGGLDFIDGLASIKELNMSKSKRNVSLDNIQNVK